MFIWPPEPLWHFYMSKLPEPTFTEGFAFAIALEMESDEAVCKAHGVSPEQWAALQQSDLFKSTVRKYIVDLKEKGYTAQLKAQCALEMSISVLFQLAHDPEVPATSRIECIKTMDKLAGGQVQEEQGGGFVFQIIAPQVATPAIDVTGSAPSLPLPAVVEHEAN